MAKSFSAKQYFQKLYSAELLTEFYKQYEIVALFEVTENTPRKNAVAAFFEFHQSLSPEEKITTEEDLARIAQVSSKNSMYILGQILKQKSLPEVTNIECISDHDFVMYHFLFNKEVFEDLEFFHQFYATKSYMLYEAGKVTHKDADFAMTELGREYARIAQKENSEVKCSILSKSLGDVFYVHATFVEPATEEEVEPKILETVKIAYLPEDKEVLITYTGKKYEKLIYLDTFLRVVCNSGYEAKELAYTLSPLQRDDFDFAKHKDGVPLMTWKIKGVTLSFGSEKVKKKMKLTLPSGMHEYGLSPLKNTLDELGLVTKWKEYSIDSVTLAFSFVHMQKGDKSVQTPCTISLTRASLCPLFPYDRYARSILKSSGVERGFIEAVKKDIEATNKKWEV
jgi:hypothetical protein